MSDPTDLTSLATSGGAATVASFSVGAFMRWLYGRDAQRKEEAAQVSAAAAREEFINLRADVKHLIAAVGEHKAVFEDVVATKLSLKALHGRFDDAERRLDRLESRRK